MLNVGHHDGLCDTTGAFPSSGVLGLGYVRNVRRSPQFVLFAVFQKLNRQTHIAFQTSSLESITLEPLNLQVRCHCSEGR